MHRTVWIALCIALSAAPAAAQLTEENGELVVYSAPKAEAKKPAAKPAPPPLSFSRTDWLNGREGYEKALEAQKLTGEPFLLYVYTDWCKYCRGFKRRVLNSERFDRAFRDTLKVQIDADAHKRLARELGVEGYPTVRVVHAAGGVVRLDHGLGVEAFVRQAEENGIRVRKAAPTVSLGLAE